MEGAVLSLFLENKLRKVEDFMLSAAIAPAQNSNGYFRAAQCQ